MVVSLPVVVLGILADWKDRWPRKDQHLQSTVSTERVLLLHHPRIERNALKLDLCKSGTNCAGSSYGRHWHDAGA